MMNQSMHIFRNILLILNNVDRYRFAFLIGPKNEYGPTPGWRCAFERVGSEWKYTEEYINDIQMSYHLLVRYLIAKVTNEKRLIRIFKDTPISNSDDFTDRTWCEAAAIRIKNGAVLGAHVMEDWTSVVDEAEIYVFQKVVDGRYAPGHNWRLPKPTWDGLQQKEFVH